MIEQYTIKYKKKILPVRNNEGLNADGIISLNKNKIIRQLKELKKIKKVGLIDT